MPASDKLLNIDNSLPILDQAFLAEMVGHDLSFGKEMLSFFLKNSSAYLDDLSNLVESPHDEWRAMVHKFKGAARSIGAKQLAAAGQIAESYLEEDQDHRRAFLDYSRQALDQIAEIDLRF